MWSRKSALELRVEAMMERVQQAGDDHRQLVPLRAGSLGAASNASDDLQHRAEAALTAMTGGTHSE